MWPPLLVIFTGVFISGQYNVQDCCKWQVFESPFLSSSPLDCAVFTVTMNRDWQLEFLSCHKRQKEIRNKKSCQNRKPQTLNHNTEPTQLVGSLDSGSWLIHQPTNENLPQRARVVPLMISRCPENNETHPLHQHTGLLSRGQVGQIHLPLGRTGPDGFSITSRINITGAVQRHHLTCWDLYRLMSQLVCYWERAAKS